MTNYEPLLLGLSILESFEIMKGEERVNRINQVISVSEPGEVEAGLIASILEVTAGYAVIVLQDVRSVFENIKEDVLSADFNEDDDFYTSDVLIACSYLELCDRYQRGQVEVAEQIRLIRKVTPPFELVHGFIIVGLAVLRTMSGITGTTTKELFGVLRQEIINISD